MTLPRGYRIGNSQHKAFTPARGGDDYYPDAEPVGHTVYEDGSWSEDQPTGILTASGEMIYRCATRIGFDLGFDDN